jgi:hypothetical protein
LPAIFLLTGVASAEKWLAEKYSGCTVRGILGKEFVKTGKSH